MDRLENAIIRKLKTGSIPTVVYFSDVDTFPAPPYVVVKPEIGVLEGTRAFRIIVHERKGMADKLSDYTLIELDSLLAGNIDDREGSRYKLLPNGYTDITPEPTDNSFFMERMYYSPLTIRN